MLTKDQIKAVSDLKPPEKVKVPEWNGEVLVKQMTARERDAFETDLYANASKDVRARLAIHSVVDESGSRMFTDADLEWLTMKSGKALDRIWGAATKLNGIGAKDVEELKKTCEEIISADSSSVSPATTAPR